MAKLIDKAKGRKRFIRPIREDAHFKEGELIELSLAWLAGDISHADASHATKRSGSSLYGLLAVSLMRAYDKGLLIIKK